MSYNLDIDPLANDDDCDECVPEYMRSSSTGVLFNALPFIITFAAVAIFVLRKVYPLLTGGLDGKITGHGRGDSEDARLPMHNYEIGGSKSTARGKSLANRLRVNVDSRKLSKAVFATTIALSAVLVELILCEISNTLDSNARRVVLQITLPTLLVLLVIVAPALEIRSIIAAAGLPFQGAGKSRTRAAWFFEILGVLGWLLSFWYIGHGLIAMFREEVLHPQNYGFSEGCLERVGVVGISLMGSLAGFAATSALWQTFGVRDKPVTDADIARKQAGLDATADMLSAKRSRLRALERKMSETRDEGFLSRVVGTIRGTGDSQERSTLQLEISGLQLMRMTLNNSLYSLRNRRAAQLRAHTTGGRLISVFSYGFAIYCAYRLLNTCFNILRRSVLSSNSSSQDLVTNVLALFAKHWDPSLNQAIWSRQISFLLSGVMLLLAFNSALQTFLLLARAFPSLFSASLASGANFALIVAQVCASYVISSALLLRSNLPSEVRGVIGDVLGAPLDTKKVDAWFEMWFIGAAILTGVGIYVGRRLNGPGEEEEAMEAGEMNKMS